MPDDVRRRTMQVLLNQVSSGRYPSPSMLDRIEASIDDRETAVEYVTRLLDNLEEEAFPSPMMLDRLIGLVQVLARSGPERGGIA
jgi:hypothetical protein